MDLQTRLNFFFGTEEYVNMRRQIVLLSDRIENYGRHGPYSIRSGSVAEGVVYPVSDEDVMAVVFCSLRVVKKTNEATHEGDVLMVPSEYSPGYCLLHVLNRSFYPETQLQIIDEKLFLSSSLLKHGMLRGLEHTHHIHGPCHSRNVSFLEFDVCTCIPCSTWPDVANNWLSKNRSYNWPSSVIIHNIVSQGCHVVPVGDPDSPHGDHEWRISFSVAERTLMHSLNHAQFLVYSLLRLTLKKIIEKAFPGVLCSFFMKTTLFFTAEKTPVTLWQTDDLETCYKACLGVLYDFVDQKCCPNYFISDCNMIKRKINYTNRSEILEILRSAYGSGIVGILHLSGESQCFDSRLTAKNMEYIQDRDFMFSYHLIMASNSIEDVFNNLPHRDPESCTFCLFIFWLMILPYTPKKLINVTWNQLISVYRIRILNYIMSSSSMNRHSHHSYENVQSLLRIGYNGDVTTGKLTMATYMYLVGKTESALYVIEKLLSEYPPYALDCTVNEVKMKIYSDIMSGKGYSIDYKARHAYAPYYILYSQCLNAFPNPLRIWISFEDGIVLDPLSYSFLLQSLCYLQLRNPILLTKSTKCLITRMDELKHDMHKADVRMRLGIANVKMCIGIIKYVQGDRQSACRWLGSVFITENNLPSCLRKDSSRSAFIYISCLLNKRFLSEIFQNQIS